MELRIRTNEETERYIAPNCRREGELELDACGRHCLRTHGEAVGAYEVETELAQSWVRWHVPSAIEGEEENWAGYL